MRKRKKSKQTDDNPATVAGDASGLAAVGSAEGGTTSADPATEQPADGDAKPADDEAAAPEPTPEEALATLNDKWLRARAETDNVRRRARLDIEDARKYSASPMISSLLLVLDSLQRALETKPEGTDDQLWEGLQLTEQLFVQALSSHGVKALETLPGSAFDPSCHQAILEQPSDEHEPGTIVTQLVRGYRFHERLLREAQVIVATAPPEPAEETPDADV
jgi:molecular chaperone GrpE